MHQPDYRDHIRDEFQLPWVYLHGIKDYVDMVAHLENVPNAKAVINFSPILLEQLQEYEKQLDGYLEDNIPIRDPLLAALDTQTFPTDNERRIALVNACLRSNKKRQIERFKAYKRLTELARMVIDDREYSAYISNQFLADLITWYHLAWLGESVRRTDPRIKALVTQESDFTLRQRRILLQVIRDLLSGLAPRYSRLVDAKQVELSMSPYAHPMLPLLHKFKVASEAMPDVRLPVLKSYPGGDKRVEWHLKYGLEIFGQYFGKKPIGCWPSEGGISSATLESISNASFRWIATGENVLRNSINSMEAHHEAPSVHRVFCRSDSQLRLFARDDELSDLIGFTYADWHADDAVTDLVSRLESIEEACEDNENTVVSIIMDGENAWEYYPENAHYFIPALYQRLVDHPRLQLSTYQELLDVQTVSLEKIVSGSWVFGTFSTWIGDEDKNKAWDILGDIKRIYDESRVNIDEALRVKIEKQLAACEGSDWFWWFGDYNPAETVSDFEHLFRLHVANLYHMLGHKPPQYLSQILSHGTGSPELGGTIRPGNSSR